MYISSGAAVTYYRWVEASVNNQIDCQFGILLVEGSMENMLDDDGH